MAIDIPAAFDVITAALAAGEITPGEAVEFGKFVEALRHAGVYLYRPRPAP
jgi:hypothetical protein